ncbi:3-phytase A [Lachnellula suecica]|uniref:3-phytase n=1 Tax=Lachnellula suecica TaxID=602035 RepID=A0A8T9BUT3_9HELO|nr:3-phytase A [Lachnellula suecica]
MGATTFLAASVAVLTGSVYAAPADNIINTNVTLEASSFVGTSTSNVYPPAGTTVNSQLFPPESVVGFPGPTPTGAEPAAAQTAPAYPYNNGPANQFPLIAPQPWGSSEFGDSFDIAKYWGNLSPWYSVSSADYGLPDASPLIPDGCTITQMHLLYRHGARYPTTGAAPSTFAQKLLNATQKAGSFSVTGELSFLSKWTYKLGAELLTPFGRSQNFNLGIAYRQLYGELLNNFTATGTLPVFRTESQDRMVKTAENFAAGFFGVPEYRDEVNIEILVETPGVNNSGAPYEVCTNSNVASRGSIGSTVATAFANNAFNATIARLQSQALGYSAFCNLFSQEDFLNYEYYYDLSFYYNNGPGSPVSAAQGKGYLQEWVARFTHSFPTAQSALNLTYDTTTTYFPLNQSIYADATHEVVVLDVLTAFNLTALFKGPPLSASSNAHRNSFVASKVVPFATHFTGQVLECPAYSPSRQIRFIVNDAVVPISDSYTGCPVNPDGLCSFDNVVSVLQKRIAEIDFNYDCFANYTAKAGVDYNGRAPRS